MGLKRSDIYCQHLTPRIYGLKFIRQIFTMDYEHFEKHNKPVTLKFPYIIGPFVAKSRATKDIAKELLQEMGF